MKAEYIKYILIMLNVLTTINPIDNTQRWLNEGVIISNLQVQPKLF